MNIISHQAKVPCEGPIGLHTFDQAENSISFDATRHFSVPILWQELMRTKVRQPSWSIFLGCG
jgi:hypothetical protein